MSIINGFIVKDGYLCGYYGRKGDITVPDGITHIKDNAFRFSDRVTSVHIPEGVKSIGAKAFWACPNLERVTLPDSLESIGGSAFSECTALTDINIPDTVSYIGNSAFSRCEGLADGQGFVIVNGILLDYLGYDKKIVIPDSVKRIGRSALSNRTFTEIIIPDTVTDIGNGAFSGCEALTTIHIPNSVTSIGAAAFFKCRGLADKDGFVIIKDILYDYYGDRSEVTVPGSVVGIAEEAFCDNPLLTTVVIPRGVEFIANWAFSYCTNLREVKVSDTVRSIGTHVFHICRELRSVVLPYGVTKIGDWAFERCDKLCDIDIPDSVTVLGESVFKGCAALADRDGFVIYRDVLYDYIGTASDISIPYGVTKISGFAFNDKCDIIRVDIPDTVTYIGKKAFADCKRLSVISIPESVNYISDDILYGCTDISELILPGTVERFSGSVLELVCNRLYETDAKIPMLVSFLKYASDSVLEASYIKVKLWFNKHKIISYAISVSDVPLIERLLSILMRIGLDEIDCYINAAFESPCCRAYLMEYKRQQYTPLEIEQAEADKILKDLGDFNDN